MKTNILITVMVVAMVGALTKDKNAQDMVGVSAPQLTKFTLPLFRLLLRAIT